LAAHPPAAFELQAVLDAAVDGIVIVDGAGRVENCNRAADRLFGLPPGGMIGMHVDRFLVQPSLEAAAAMEGTGRAHEISARRADGTVFPVSVSVARISGSPTPRYISVPRETQDVFRVVALRNPLDAPLLPGPVDVYVGGRFALASSVEVTPPRGRVELGLGVEQAIKIARNVSFEEEASGLLKRSLELQHSVKVEIKNHLPRPATVEVRERLPVTREGESDVEVMERAVDPAWDDLKQEVPLLRGGRAWKVEVPAGGERTLRASYAIRIPQNHEIVGGNRREG